VTDSPAATPLPTPTIAGTIAFEKVIDPSQGGGNADIYVMNADGTGLKQLTDDPGFEERPAWSPDGRRIAYAYYPPGWTGPESASIWIMNADGSRKARLMKDAVRGIHPAWSPDGKRIAFASPLARGYRIFVVNADGSHLVRVTRPPSGGILGGDVNDVFPTWLPNGTILFLRQGQVFAVNPDGSRLQPLTKGENIAEFAASPDGKRLALHYNNSDRLTVLGTRGGGSPETVLEPVTDYIRNHEGYPASPSWAADGRALAVGTSSYCWGHSLTAASSRMYVVNADGSGLSAVPGVDNALDPAWRPQ
jgi:Tol biopolymer transport system component